MKLKELLIKSGGVISSIALLGSMFSMANAAADPSGTKPYVCALCNDSFYLYNYQNAPTYQQCYSTDTIVGLTNDAYHVYTPGVSSIKVNAAQYNEQYICENCLSKIVAEHKASPSNYISSPGSGNTPITVTADASTFSVTVPTSIPLVINADGSVTAPTDVKIVNGSAGSVQVSSIAMNDGDWTLTDYNSGNRSKLAEAKVDSKKLGLSLTAAGNAASTSKDGSQTPSIDVSKWTMAGGSELPITVGAIATASSAKSASEVTAANVVFTLAWKESIITFSIRGKGTYHAREGMTWREFCESTYNNGDLLIVDGAVRCRETNVCEQDYSLVNPDSAIKNGFLYRTD